MSAYRIAGYEFSDAELRDLLVAWIALGVAFAIFFAHGAGGFLSVVLERGLLLPVVVSLFTAGVGFLLHEVAHKVVAVHYGQFAEFRADYSMLFLAVMSAMIGFIFAAPGAVHHRGYLTEREHGLIALAGPATNVLLTVAFVPLLFVGSALGSDVVWLVGERGVAINVFLAAFNMIPYGPLDGKTVIGWSKLVWLLVFLPTAAVAFVGVFVLGFGFGGGF